MATTKSKSKAKPKAPQVEPRPAFSLERALAAISERNTPEQQAEMGRLSRLAIGRIDPNSPAAKAKRAKTLEASVLNQIKHLQKEPESELRTTRLRVARDRLGELRAEQGDFVGAISVTHNPKRSDYYEKIQRAIERPDEEKCECPTFQARDGKRIVTLSPRFKAQTIMTPTGPRNLMLCATCGFMNAK